MLNNLVTGLEGILRAELLRMPCNASVENYNNSSKLHLEIKIDQKWIPFIGNKEAPRHKDASLSSLFYGNKGS